MQSKQKKILYSTILLFRVSLRHAFTRIPWSMRMILLTQEPAFWYRTRIHCALFASRGMHMSKSDTEEKKLLNKVIFVFFAFKKYSRSFIELRLNHWCHMDYFNNVLTTFLGLECGSCIAVYEGSENNKKQNLNLCYGFGTTWGWVINDRIFIFEWTIPLR